MGSSDWKSKKLGSLCSKIGSGATPRGGKEAYLEKGPFALIRSQNVLDFFFSYQGLAFINEEQASQLNNVELQERDVLLNITGDSVARVCQVPKEILPARVNQHVSIIRPDSAKLHTEYLKYFLLNPKFKNYMLSLASVGGTRNALTKGMIEDFDIELPELPIQERIASILSALDDKIELNRQTNQTLEAIAQAIYKEWFVNNIDCIERISLQKIIDFDPRIAVKKGEKMPSVNMAELSKEGMTIGNIVHKNYSGGTKFQNNDTLLARITPCLENGKTAFVNFLSNEEPVGIGSTEFIVMRAKAGISPHFVYFLSRDSNFRSFAIKSMMGSSGRQRVQRGMLEKYEISKPNQDLMENFHKITKPLFKRIRDIWQESENLKELRNSLLPKLMSADIRVSAVNFRRPV